jgi:hypothetical protein
MTHSCTSNPLTEERACCSSCSPHTRWHAVACCCFDTCCNTMMQCSPHMPTAATLRLSTYRSRSVTLQSIQSMQLLWSGPHTPCNCCCLRFCLTKQQHRYPKSSSLAGALPTQQDQAGHQVYQMHVQTQFSQIDHSLFKLSTAHHAVLKIQLCTRSQLSICNCWAAHCGIQSWALHRHTWPLTGNTTSLCCTQLSALSA